MMEPVDELPIDNSEVTGECRFNAPTFLLTGQHAQPEELPFGTLDGIWPRTRAKDWCGRFSASKSNAT
jgi:hypothetical protein